MLANYHTHTSFCKHAYGTEREYIENAIKAGMKILGFSDHSPQLYQNGYVSGMRMTPTEAKTYSYILHNLKEEYKNDIEIHIGFEAEYFPEIFGSLQNLCRDCGIEYLILGQHSLVTEGHPDFRWTRDETTDKGLFKTYIDLLIEAMHTGSFSYIAHPDIFNFKGDGETYYNEWERLCKSAKELNIPLEFNLLGYVEKRSYPNDEFFNIAKSVNNDIVIGCDAHSPHELRNIRAQDEIKQHLKNLGLNVIATINLKKI